MPIAFASWVVRSGAAEVTLSSARRFEVERRAAIRFRVVAGLLSVRPGSAGTTRTTLRAPIAKPASFGAWLTRLLRLAKNLFAAGPESSISVDPPLGRESSLAILARVRCQPPDPYARSAGADT